MATYAIGDVQGCYRELQALLTHIHFQADTDTLWFTGDLVNRGPRSLDVLRYVKDLGGKHITVLGNHDLHLLAVVYADKAVNQSDTLQAILTAPDKYELMDWLRARPLLHVDNAMQFVMAHAGIAPFWTISKARELADEVETILRGPQPEYLLRDIYGNQPDKWRDDLLGIERLRCIVNYFTRMRFCYDDGRLDLTYKGDIANKPAALIPWFDVNRRMNATDNIIFGHWAGLNGKADVSNVYPLDTGCVWGNALTAMRLEDAVRFSVRAGG